MRVLITGYINDIHVVRWCNALAQRGLDIHLATVHRSDGMNALDENVTVHQLSERGGIGYLTAVPALKRLASRLNPDLIHAHYAGGYGTMTRLSGVRPFLLSVYGDDVFETPKISWLHRKIIADNIRKADHIASTSHIMKQVTQRLCSQAQITVTPFGVDTELFRPHYDQVTEDTHDAPLLNRDSTITIGTVKKLTDKYGIDTLIRAFALLVNNLPERAFKLEITGNGPLKTKLQQLARKLGVAEQVTFYPAVPHEKVPDQLRRLDVFVAVSRRDGESFGVSIVEAMATGVPVVVSNVGGLPEVTGYGRHASIIPPDDPERLFQAIHEYLKHPQKVLLQVQDAREHVIRTYNWSTCVNTVIHLYQEIKEKRS